jgi:hypothetical protein
MGHAVKFCNVNQVKPLIYSCFNLEFRLSVEAELLLMKLITLTQINY